MFHMFRRSGVNHYRSAHKLDPLDTSITAHLLCVRRSRVRVAAPSRLSADSDILRLNRLEQMNDTRMKTIEPIDRVDAC